jgi:hypothetical protein
VIAGSLDKQFAALINSLKELVRNVDTDQLYGRVGDTSFAEQILRSAAAIEQTLGGLTANLWDDPFEWTLPETLSTPELVIEHLSEVDGLRQRFFSSINDEALSKFVSVPSGEPRVLVELLHETLVRASDIHKEAQRTQKELLSSPS